MKKGKVFYLSDLNILKGACGIKGFTAVGFLQILSLRNYILTTPSFQLARAHSEKICFNNHPICVNCCPILASGTAKLLQLLQTSEHSNFLSFNDVASPKSQNRISNQSQHSLYIRSLISLVWYLCYQVWHFIWAHFYDTKRFTLRHFFFFTETLA